MKQLDIAGLDNALVELEKYNYSYIQEKISRVRDIVDPLIESEKRQEFKRERKLKYSWANFEPYSRVQTMVNDLKSVSKFSKEAQDELRCYDNETQDILHALEFLDNTPEEMLKLSQDLSEIRKNRRVAKSFIELSSSLVEFVESNRTSIDKLVKVSVNTQSCFDKLERRMYTPKAKTSLAEAFKTFNEKEELS